MSTFVMPKRIKVEEEREGPDYYYSRYVLSPLEKGYSITIGNALRRVLLSSIPAMAVTAVKFIKPEKYHEYDTIEGVKEDILEIILNLKKIQFRTEIPIDSTIRMIVEKKGPGFLKAGDIKTPAGIEVMNPDHVIATLNEDADLMFELYVEMGKGYEPASERDEKPEIGWIPIDGVFSPVLKVNFLTENVRVGKRTDYDKLVLEVWTKKSIKPSEALKKAVEILSDHLQIIAQSLPQGEFQEEAEIEVAGQVEEEQKFDNKDEILSLKIEELGLSQRTVNSLKREHIETIGDLVSKTEKELLKIKNFGQKSLEDVKKKLKEKFDLDLRKEE